MENIVVNGIPRDVVHRYKAVLDSGTNKVVAVPLKAIYRVKNGVAVLWWSLIRSCFGNGFWHNDQPWRDDEGWKNG